MDGPACSVENNLCMNFENKQKKIGFLFKIQLNIKFKFEGGLLRFFVKQFNFFSCLPFVIGGWDSFLTKLFYFKFKVKP